LTRSGSIRYLWAAPNSLLGLLLIPLALAGGQVRRHHGILEASGGALKWALGPWIEALTLGHVILAKDELRLRHWRDHERRHVLQYERWGPFFLPLYLFLGIWCWLRGRHPYGQHPFELDAGLVHRRP
jgi:hypothetical protein